MHPNPTSHSAKPRTRSTNATNREVGSNSCRDFPIANKICGIRQKLAARQASFPSSDAYDLFWDLHDGI